MPKTRGHPAGKTRSPFLPADWQQRASKTMLAGILSDAWNAYTAPRRAYQGLLDPMSDEAIKNMVDLAGMVTLGSGGAQVPKGALRSGMARNADDVLAVLDDLDIAKFADEYDHIGLRTVEKGYDPLQRSHVWVDGERLDDMLSGVSATDIREAKAKAMHGLAAKDYGAGYYPGDDTYLLGSYVADSGEDIGELVMREPVVLARIKRAKEAIQPK
jgi:hypothetical protein